MDTTPTPTLPMEYDSVPFSFHHPSRHLSTRAEQRMSILMSLLLVFVSCVGIILLNELLGYLHPEGSMRRRM
jgi:hypothetical protein